MTQITDKHWAVEVPDKIDNPNFYRVNNESIMFKWGDVDRPLNPHDVVRIDKYSGDLKDYKWPVFLFTTATATEEELKPLDYILQHNNFKEWFIDFCNRLTYFFNRKDSLESLLLSKKLNPNKNYAIIEKMK